MPPSNNRIRPLIDTLTAGAEAFALIVGVGLLGYLLGQALRVMAS